jgi:hypothetical protein
MPQISIRIKIYLLLYSHYLYSFFSSGFDLLDLLDLQNTLQTLSSKSIRIINYVCKPLNGINRYQ